MIKGFGQIRVDGAGPMNARMLLLGQSPGEIEEQEGEPFVGPVGQFLQQCVKYVGLEWRQLRRENVFRYRLNIKNHNEVVDIIISRRTKILQRLQKLSRVKVAVALGNEAMFATLNLWGITRFRGNPVMNNIWTIVPTLHPSYILRNGKDPELVRRFIKDLKLAKVLLES